MIFIADKKLNNKCCICGKAYYACNYCKDQRDLYPWKAHTDTQNHYKVYITLHGYSTKVLNKSECRERLLNMDISDIEDYKDNIKALIKDIIGVAGVDATTGETLENEEPVTSTPKKTTAKKTQKKVAKVTEET